MAVYGSSHYGTDAYGLTAPTGSYPGSVQAIPVINTAYLIQGFTAGPVDYENVLLMWDAIDSNTIATVTEFRLLSNPWGFPVDQNDGTILVDLTGSFHQITQYTDATIAPGKIAYYGIYLLTTNGSWVRAGFATCLMPVNYGSGQRLFELMPTYFQSFNTSDNQSNTAQDLTPPAVPASGTPLINPYANDVTIAFNDSNTSVMVNGVPIGAIDRFTLPVGGVVVLGYTPPEAPVWRWYTVPDLGPETYISSYLNVLGYGLDFLRTQYDFELASLNNPMKMALGDVQNLALQLGIPYSTEIPAYDMRKAVLYWTKVMLERGTLGGISEHITLLTGYDVDLHLSSNIMLDDDQSKPVNPVYPAWSANTPYVIGNIVTYPVAQPWNPASTYANGSVVEYNGLLYTATTTITVTPPGNTGWSQNVAGPYTYACIANVVTAPGTAPSGSLGSNATWTVIYGGDKNGSEYTESLPIPGLLGNADTWEFLTTGGTELDTHVGVGFPDPLTWLQSATTPQTIPNGVTHTIRALNNTAGSLSGTLLRSLCRGTTGSVNPDPQLVVEHGIPVPRVGNEILPWSSAQEYHTNDLAQYGNINFAALRGSTNAAPPSLGVPLNANYDFESSFTGTWFEVDGGSTLSRVTSPVFHGTHSGLVTYTGTEAQTIIQSAMTVVIPGATYQVTGFAYGVTTGQQGHINIVYNDPFGNPLSSNTTTAISFPQNVWTPFSLTFTVPLGTYSVNTDLINTNPSPGSSFTVNTAWDYVTLDCVATPEWAPLSRDARVPVVISGYALDDLGSVSPAPASTVVTPFVEWYDDWGNFIVRVFAQTETNYVWDSFETGAGVPLLGRTTDDGSEVWSVPLGQWIISTNGSAYANTTSSLGIVQVASSGYQAATITQAAPPGFDVGILFWFSNTTNFWFAGVSAMYCVIAGVTTIIPYTSGSLAPGDRLIVQTVRTAPSVTVYANTIASTPLITLLSMPGGSFVPSGSTSYGGIAMAAI
jgi:hypothetical protein